MALTGLKGQTLGKMALGIMVVNAQGDAPGNPCSVTWPKLLVFVQFDGTPYRSGLWVSPDFNADEAVWNWAREEVTANECLGTKAKVQEKMYVFFGGLAHRKDEVKHRCRTLLQARADALMMKTATPLPSLQNVVPTLALV